MGQDGRLSRATMELWRLATDLVWREVSYDHAMTQTQGGWDIGPYREKAGTLVRAKGTWDAEVDLALAIEYASPADRSNPTARALDESAATALECLRIGMLVATGRSGEIPPAQVTAVRKAFENSDMLRPLAPAAKPARRGRGGAGTTDWTVAFRHAYRQAGGNGRGARTLTLTDSTAPLGHADPGTAPVVARLVGARNEPIPVRALGDGYIRPVFLPGSQAPADLASFREAARHGGHWEDNPFMARPYSGRTLVGLDSVAFPAGRRFKGDAEAENEATAECLARARGLVVVEGIVHRPSPPPTLHLTTVASTYELQGHRIAWRMGDTHMLRGGSPFGMDLRGDDLLEGNTGGYATGFGPGEAAQLADVMRACSEEAGEAFPVRFRDAPAVAWADASAFPARRHAVLDHVAGLARAGAIMWRDIPGLSGAMAAGGDELSGLAAHMSDMTARFREPFGTHPDTPGLGRESTIVARGLLRVARLQAKARMRAEPDPDAAMSGFSP